MKRDVCERTENTRDSNGMCVKEQKIQEIPFCSYILAT